MFCAISGNAPEHPVVSTKSGHVFEQSVIEKYIESTGKCPVTSEPLAAEDLLPRGPLVRKSWHHQAGELCLCLPGGTRRWLSPRGRG